MTTESKGVGWRERGAFTFNDTDLSSTLVHSFGILCIHISSSVRRCYGAFVLSSYQSQARAAVSVRVSDGQ